MIEGTDEDELKRSCAPDRPEERDRGPPGNEGGSGERSGSVGVTGAAVGDRSSGTADGPTRAVDVQRQIDDLVQVLDEWYGEEANAAHSDDAEGVSGEESPVSTAGVPPNKKKRSAPTRQGAGDPLVKQQRLRCQREDRQRNSGRQKDRGALKRVLPPSPDSSSSSESDVDVRAGYTFRFPAREGPPTAKDVRRAAHNPLAALYRLWDGSGQGENDVAPPDRGMTADSEEYVEIETRCLEGFNHEMNPYEPEVGCACCGERPCERLRGFITLEGLDARCVSSSGHSGP